MAVSLSPEANLETKVGVWVIGVALGVFAATFIADLVLDPGQFSSGPYITACSSAIGLVLGSWGARALMSRRANGPG